MYRVTITNGDLIITTILDDEELQLLIEEVGEDQVTAYLVS